jgi:PAS domain-containing protein
VQTDREALEHIARAVQGRVLRGPGSLSPAGALGLETLALSRASLEALLEAMPAAIGILAHGDLIHANAAFAYAFGYRSYEELQAAGGIEAVVPGGTSLLRAEPNTGRGTIAVDALTRGRRRLKVSFEIRSLGAEHDMGRESGMPNEQIPSRGDSMVGGNQGTRRDVNEELAAHGSGIGLPASEQAG